MISYGNICLSSFTINLHIMFNKTSPQMRHHGIQKCGLVSLHISSVSERTKFLRIFKKKIPKAVEYYKEYNHRQTLSNTIQTSEILCFCFPFNILILTTLDFFSLPFQSQHATQPFIENWRLSLQSGLSKISNLVKMIENFYGSTSSHFEWFINFGVTNTLILIPIHPNVFQSPKKFTNNFPFY